MWRTLPVLAGLALLVACDRPGEGATPGERPPESATPPTVPDEPAVFRAQRALMGTVFVITVSGAEESVAAPAVARAFDEIARLETLLSEWRDESEVSRINAGAGSAPPVPVSPDVLRVVQAGVDVSRRSEGAFDLSWAALHGLYRFPPNPVRLPTDEALAARLPLIDWTAIAVDADAGTVRLARDGMAIGTGGIAKGYALDRAAAVLGDAGLDAFMLFGGGQVQVRGTKGNRAWRVGIQHPRQPSEYFAFLESDGGSISTSGDYEHFHVDDAGRRWHHIIDPRTGRPAQGLLSVTMLAPRGLHADALSTACFVLGRARCLAMLREHPDRPEAVLVDDALRVHVTPGTEKRLVFTAPLRDGRLPR